MKLVMIVTGALVMGVVGCKKPEAGTVAKRSEYSDVEPVEQSSVLALPIERTITGKDGRELDVTIIKRTTTHIAIVRKRDQKAFTLALEKLSDADREFVKTLPVSEKLVKSNEDIREEGRKKALRELEEKVRELEKELFTGALNGSQTSMVEGKVQRLKREILKLGGKTDPSDFVPRGKKGSSGNFIQ
ncbi:MAG: hypothetical protein QM496_03300 [Verrucomicrobiota bacterium]